MSKISGYDDSLNSYICQIKKIPSLTFEEELELSRNIKTGDENARRRFIEANLKLVVKIAYGYSVKNISIMDLIQEGNIGLIRAVDKYDYQVQARFSTYAVWWIRLFISRYLTGNRRIIRLPHKKEELFLRIQYTYHILSQLYMRKPTIKEIAAEICVPKNEVEIILGLSHDTLSLEAEYDSSESGSLNDCIADFTYCPEQEFIKKSSREATLGIINSLMDREKNVIIYRYQFGGEKRYTLNDISGKMGLSRETVRQIENKALGKLRRHSDDLRFYAEVM